MKSILIISFGIIFLMISCLKDNDTVREYKILINKEITNNEIIFINFGDTCNIKETNVIKIGDRGHRTFSYIMCQECYYRYEPENNYYGSDQAIIKISKMNNENYLYTINILIK